MSDDTDTGYYVDTREVVPGAFVHLVIAPDGSIVSDHTKVRSAVAKARRLNKARYGDGR